MYENLTIPIIGTGQDQRILILFKSILLTGGDDTGPKVH